MAIPIPHSTLVIEIDAVLAVTYRDAYLRIHVSRDEVKQTLEAFVAGFVEDRLAEEIVFLENETIDSGL